VYLGVRVGGIGLPSVLLVAGMNLALIENMVIMSFCYSSDRSRLLRHQLELQMEHTVHTWRYSQTTQTTTTSMTFKQP